MHGCDVATLLSFLFLVHVQGKALAKSRTNLAQIESWRESTVLRRAIHHRPPLPDVFPLLEEVHPGEVVVQEPASVLTSTASMNVPAHAETHAVRAAADDRDKTCGGRTALARAAKGLPAARAAVDPAGGGRVWMRGRP
jgi:hypothetical protein